MVAVPTGDSVRQAPSQPAPTRTATSSHTRLKTGAALLIILAAATFLRTWQLNTWPPGFNHDEAVNALDVERIIAGWRPVFLPSNNGREALFMYLQAALGAVFGVSPATMRLAAAVCGVVGVFLTYLLGSQWFGRRAGLIAAGFLATAFWHVVLSRVGLRAIMVPDFYVATFWLLTLQITRPKWWLPIVTGAVLGLAQYTYISARLLPGILLIGLGFISWRRWKSPSSRRLWQDAGLMYASAVVVVLPEALYFLRHPETFIGRTDQVMVFNPHPSIIGKPITFFQSLHRTLGMFWVAGDHNWLHNISGMPMLDGPQLLLFTPGVLLCLYGVLAGLRAIFARKGGALERQASRVIGAGASWPALWITGWCSALLLGSSFTQESPNYLRLTALMPAICLVLAWGFEGYVVVISHWLRGRPLSLWSPWCAGVLGALMLVHEGVRTYDLYFKSYVQQPGTYIAYDTDIKDASTAASQITGIPVKDTFIQLDAMAPFQFFRPVDDSAHWLREYSTVVPLPQLGQPALWVYSHFQQVPPLPSYLPEARLVARGVADPGHPGFFVYTASAQDLAHLISRFHPVAQSAQFGSALQLVGTRVETSSTVLPGDHVKVMLLWRVLKPGVVNYGVSIHLVDQHEHTWAQGDDQGMMRNGWHTGDLFLSRYDIQIPGDVPPIMLRAEALASVLDPLHQPAAVLKSLGAGDTIATFRVGSMSAGSATSLQRGTLVEPGLWVSTDGISPSVVGPGDALEVTLQWLRTAAVAAAPVTLEAVDPRGTVVAESAGAIGYGALPLDQLPQGVVTADPRRLVMPPRLPTEPLNLQLIVGSGMHRLVLGTVAARDRPHVYQLPHVQIPASDNFGGLLSLRGVDIASPHVSPGSTLTVTLVWQDESEMSVDYKVFVHLLDPSGQIVAQNDSMPVSDTRPTRGWLTGEVVVDTHAIPIPRTLAPGTYRVEVGVYDPNTGKRLLLADPQGSDHIDLPSAIVVS
ncbi:MAG: glycosyltransferase family 39 protein [Chloroflexi bacterium]|nr:glycosyltransferase family 39 protein [Chloroflexota bacterium]